MEFPRFVFKDHGPHQRAGGSYDHALVESQAEFDAALKAGWFATLPEALETKPVAVPPPSTETKPMASPPADDAPPTRAELEAKAKELGIEFSPNIGDKKLGERIQAALDAQKPPEA